LLQVRGETSVEWYHRYKHFSPEQQELITIIHVTQGEHKTRRCALKCIDEDALPLNTQEGFHLPEFKQIVARWSEAHSQAWDKARQDLLEYQKTDKAWEEQLSHRRWCANTFRNTRYIDPENDRCDVPEK